MALFVVKSHNISMINYLPLFDFSKSLMLTLYKKWEGILEYPNATHQVYLYSLCDTNPPVDLKGVLLISLAESLVEIVKSNDIMENHLYRLLKQFLV